MKTVKVIKNLEKSSLEQEIRDRVRKIVYELKSAESLVDVLMYQGGNSQDYNSVSYIASDIDRHCRKVLDCADDIRQFAEYLASENEEVDNAIE